MALYKGEDVRHQRARQLRAEGIPIPEIAAALNVSGSTVQRWTNTEEYERSLETARAWKARQPPAHCADCGRAIRYDHTRCFDCHIARVGARSIDWRGTGSHNSRVLALLADGEEHRFIEIRNRLNIPETQMGGMLRRLLDYGLIERPARGRYRIRLQQPASTG